MAHLLLISTVIKVVYKSIEDLLALRLLSSGVRFIEVIKP